MKIKISLAFIFFVVLIASSIFLFYRVSKHIRYDVVDLGTLGGNSSVAYGINDNDQIVGQSDTRIVSSPGHIHISPSYGIQIELPRSTDESPQAFLWDNGRMRRLSTLPDRYFGQTCDDETEAYSINDTDQIVGKSTYGALDGNNQPLYDAVMWKIDGSPTDLGTVLGYRCSLAYKINRLGKVVGQGISEEDGPTTHIYRSCAALFAEGVGQKTPTSPNGFTINDRDQRLGSVSWHGQNYLVLWVGKSLVAKTILPISQCLLASALNNHGQAAVTLTESNNTDPSAALFSPCHAGLWEKGRLQSLGTLSGYPSAHATSINESGQIVGWVSEAYHGKPTSPLMKAVLWEDGFAKDLNGLVPENSGWQLQCANGINNRGQIVGWGIYHDQKRAYLLTPVSDHMR